MAEKLNFKKSMWLMCGSIGNGGGGWSKFKSFKIYTKFTANSPFENFS